MSGKLHYLYRAYRYRFSVDPAELRYVCSKLRPGQTGVDVGCHKGAYTYWMRRRVGRTGRIIAFEPQPRQVDYLRRIFAAMRYENVALVPQGLSDAPGQLSLHVPEGAGKTHAASFEHVVAPLQNANASVGETRLQVAVTTLDEFFAEQARGPDFLKIDVEGHESAVLDGARKTLETHRPAILIECEARHRRDGDVQPVFELLESFGYRGSFFQNGRRRPLAEFDPAVHQRIDADSDQLPRGYVNNFAFE